MIHPERIGIDFVCPACRHTVLYHDHAWVCTSEECRLRYPIVDDIPKFLVEEAAQLSHDEWRAVIDSPRSLAPE